MNRKLTLERKQFIKANYETTSLETMASVCGVCMTTIKQWCDELGLKAGERKMHPNTAKIEQVKKVYLPVKKQEGRPPAEYSNTSREQHVEKWLNVAI